MMEEGKARIFAFALPEAPRFSFLFLRKLKAQVTQAAKGDLAAAFLGSTWAVPGRPVAVLLVCELGGGVLPSLSRAGLMEAPSTSVSLRERTCGLRAVKWTPLSQGLPPSSLIKTQRALGGAEEQGAGTCYF